MNRDEGVDPRDAEIEELRRLLGRLHHKHRRYAEMTNKLLTEQAREITRLKEASGD
jgi:hypothetical protein